MKGPKEMNLLECEDEKGSFLRMTTGKGRQKIDEKFGASLAAVRRGGAASGLRRHWLDMLFSKCIFTILHRHLLIKTCKAAFCNVVNVLCCKKSHARVLC